MVFGDKKGETMIQGHFILKCGSERRKKIRSAGKGTSSRRIIFKTIFRIEDNRSLYC